MLNNICYFNGRYDFYKNLKVGFLGNSLNFGTGIIDSIRVYKKKEFYYFIGLDYYIDRFIESNINTYYNFTISKQSIKKIIIKLLKLNKGITNPYFRLITFFGDDDLNIIQNKNNYNFAVGIMDLNIPKHHLSATFSSFGRANSILNKYKLSMNYGRNLIDLYNSKKRGYNAVIYLDEEGNILELISENIFLIKNNIIYTPRLNNILSGINRKMIIYIFKNIFGLKVIEKDIHKEELIKFDEVFICGTATGIRSINKIDNKIIGNESCYELTDKIKNFFLKDIFNYIKIDDISIYKFKL